MSIIQHQNKNIYVIAKNSGGKALVSLANQILFAIILPSQAKL